MKSAVQLVVLLACIFLCSSARIIMKCQCINTIPAMRRELIKDVKVHEPSPACKKRQVIVTRNDDKKFCLNPETDFTKKLLLEKEMNNKKLSTTTTTTTTAATTQPATAATSSVTNQ
ncbi:growth-regulated protein homolog gamma-like [Xiphophorus maculatus]|uniref:growth-regulated protein homolog gamma-like n=1 Tax=Xiphophorus maculatus TaxID=8083 RepID=UPI000C6D6BD7|nr:growth-regulated protein homolog gamma-like [Xiphophorus maculatus]